MHHILVHGSARSVERRPSRFWRQFVSRVGRLGRVAAAVLLLGLAAPPPTATAAALPQAKLLLWNTLDNPFEVRHSLTGPGGSFTTGTFKRGVFGNAFNADFSQSFGVTFPATLINSTRGTIEFWGQLGPSLQGSIQGGGGNRPMFVRALDPTNHFGEQIFLTDNNGLGMGGLAGQAGACNGTGTNTFSGNTYEDVLGETSVHWWHHYALIWDSRGLPGVDNGKATVALYMDRRLVSRFWNADCSPITFPKLPPGSLIKLLDFDRVDVGSARIDNLRIWDCATIYFHPNREAPVGRTCIR